VDAVLLDAEPKALKDIDVVSLAQEALKRSLLFCYHDSDVWGRAVLDQIFEFLRVAGVGKVVAVGEGVVASKVVDKLRWAGLAVDWPASTLTTSDRFTTGQALDLSATSSTRPCYDSEIIRVLCGFATDSPVVTTTMVSDMRPPALVLDAGIGSLAPGVVDECITRGLRVMRVDMRAALAAEIAAKFGAYRLFNDVAGRDTIAGQTVVAGGELGRAGDIVLDSISTPRLVLGVADGRGQVVEDIPPVALKTVGRVAAEIAQRNLEGFPK
jgi:hypothetical protein